MVRLGLIGTARTNRYFKSARWLTTRPCLGGGAVSSPAISSTAPIAMMPNPRTRRRLIRGGSARRRGQQPIEPIPDDAVAFAGRRFQSLAIEHRHAAVLVRDQSILLERLRGPS